MKKILIMPILCFLFGFTPDYYTEENTREIENGENTLTVDTEGKEITGLFITHNKEFGNIIATSFVKGRINGLNKYFSDDLNYYLETEYKDGFQDGLQTFYELNDNFSFNIDSYISKSSNLKEVIDNITTFFSEHSTKTRTIEYKNDLKDGIEESYFETPEGSSSTITTYSKGIKNGSEKECYYHLNESFCIEKNYVNGHKNGLQKVFMSDKIIYDEIYEKDILNGLMNVYDNGIIIETIPYVNGEKKGKGFYYGNNGNKMIELGYKKNKMSYLKILSNSNKSKSISFFYEDNSTKAFCYNQLGKKRTIPKYKLDTFFLKLSFVLINTKPTRTKYYETFSNLAIGLCE